MTNHFILLASEGERTLISGDRTLLETVFPEVLQPPETIDYEQITWATISNENNKAVTRFPLNSLTKLNSLQTIERLLNVGFQVIIINS